MNIHLCDLSQELCDEWAEAFNGVDRDMVSIHNCDFRDLEPKMVSRSGIVSPANSFGFMNGGIDGAYTRHFGPDLQSRLQMKIADHYNGELLVGQATPIAISPARHGRGFDYLISAPTMRVPLPVVGTPNVYLATKAAFRACSEIGLSSVLIPGMGTGAGLMPVRECASVMRRAYDHARGPKAQSYPNSLMTAIMQHRLDCGSQIVERNEQDQ